MILTRSTHLIQPQGPVEVSPEFGGRGVVYLPNVRSNINRVAGQVGRAPTPQGISAVYEYSAGTQIERLNGSAPNGVTEFTQIVYITPQAGGELNDRGIFGNWGSTGATGLVQFTHRARDASSNGKYCYVFSYDPTSAAASAGIRTADNSAAIGAPALLIATVKNNTLSLYLNGVKHASTAVSAVPMSSQADLQIGNYYDNISGRRLSANVHLAAFLPRGMGDAEVAALSSNPWQLFRPVQRRIYFDVSSIAPSLDHILTAESTIQQILCEAGNIAQESTLAGSISVQNAVSSNGILQQVNTLIGDNSFSSNLSAVSALEQLNILQGNSQQTTNLSSDSSVAQIHNLSALSAAVEVISSAAGILQNNILLANSCLVPNYSASGSIALVPITDLSGNSVSQYGLSSSGNLLQDHILAQNTSEQPVLGSSDAVVQSHILISDNSTQIVLSSSGAIGASSSLLGNNAQQTNTSSAGFIIQASFLQGNVVKQLNLSSSGAITQGGELPPLTDAELRSILAGMQLAIAKLQVRLDSMF